MRVSRSTHARRGFLSPALALALAVAAVLLFSWPLLREPRLHLLPAFLHVLATWVLIIAGLGWLSRRPTLEDEGSGDRDA